MAAHFTSFTAEAMGAFSQQIAVDAQHRREALDGRRRETAAFLAGFRADHQRAENDRRRQAVREADGRRGFMTELRASVAALRDQLEAGRRERAGDLLEMANELHAACDAFRNRTARGITEAATTSTRRSPPARKR